MARKILLADDSVTAQNMGRKILADAGYEVVTVNNGSAALKRIAELKPDLIILDVYMPGYSGLEVCQRLKDAAETARIPVLLTVGKLEPFKAQEARRVRADAHIVKPFEASELLAAITRLEDRRAQSLESDPSIDTGWTSRLSIPPKKKKDGTESEEGAPEAAFRDFRRGKSKAGAASTATELPTPVQDPGLVSEIPDDITPQELDALSALAAKLDGSPPAAENIAPPRTQQIETPAPVAEPAAASVPATSALEAAAPEAERKSEVEIPVEPVQPPAEAFGAAVNTAQLAEDPAPVDRDDEPMFASAASAVAQTLEEKIEEKIKGQQAEPEELPPSDTELAEALRLLTPATGHAGISTVPADGTLPAEEVAREQATHHAASVPRWVAEPVALSPEESSISLEAEMFRTFAAIPSTMLAPSSAVELESARINSVSAITAAVENRLTEAGLAASSKAAAHGTDSCPETAVTEALAPETPSEAAPEQVPVAEILAMAQPAPMAMAAAAAAQGGASSARDAIAIANIVDSVLADLRPKILEEITKKLAGK